MHNPNFIEVRRLDLLAMQRALSGRFENGRAALSGATGDRDAEAGDCDLDLMTCLITNRSSDELEKIEDALDRIKSGSYGRCESCGCEILEERLEYMPWASRCVECQRLDEER